MSRSGSVVGRGRNGWEGTDLAIGIMLYRLFGDAPHEVPGFFAEGITVFL
jgi:hypothetical protein